MYIYKYAYVTCIYARSGTHESRVPELSASSRQHPFPTFVKSSPLTPTTSAVSKHRTVLSILAMVDVVLRSCRIFVYRLRRVPLLRQNHTTTAVVLRVHARQMSLNVAPVFFCGFWVSGIMAP